MTGRFLQSVDWLQKNIITGCPFPYPYSIFLSADGRLFQGNNDLRPVMRFMGQQVAEKCSDAV